MKFLISGFPRAPDFGSEWKPFAKILFQSWDTEIQSFLNRWLHWKGLSNGIKAAKQAFMRTQIFSLCRQNKNTRWTLEHELPKNDTRQLEQRSSNFLQENSWRNTLSLSGKKTQLHNAGRVFYTDNFHTFPALAENLLNRRSSFVGTVHSNRRGFPLELKADLKYFEKQAQQGETCYLPGENILIQQCKDHRVVSHESLWAACRTAPSAAC